MDTVPIASGDVGKDERAWEDNSASEKKVSAVGRLPVVEDPSDGTVCHMCKVKAVRGVSSVFFL